MRVAQKNMNLPGNFRLDFCFPVIYEVRTAEHNGTALQQKPTR